MPENYTKTTFARDVRGTLDSSCTAATGDYTHIHPGFATVRFNLDINRGELLCTVQQGRSSLMLRVR